MSAIDFVILPRSGRRLSRQRRSIRFRSTDRADTFFETTHAARGPPKEGTGVTEREKYSPCTRRAARGRRTKSARESRYFFGMGQTIYTESFARPLRRRRIKTFFPEVLAERARKPCVRARLRFFGCQFRFVDMRPLYSLF